MTILFDCITGRKTTQKSKGKMLKVYFSHYFSSTDIKAANEKKTSQVSSLFQREGVNQLLNELSKKFPPSLIKVTIVEMVLNIYDQQIH